MPQTGSLDQMSFETALLSDVKRHELKLNPYLGAGNFLHVAYSINEKRGVPIIHSDVPFQVLGGQSCKVLSIAQLKEIAACYGAWYIARGVKPMDPVGVYLPEGIAYLIHYVALTGIGSIPVLTNGAMPADIAAQHFKRVGAVGIITDQERQESLQAFWRDEDLYFLASVEEVEGEDPEILSRWYPYQHDFNDPVMITHSSGTTGAPKPVLLQHGSWFHGIRHLLGLDIAQGAERYLSSLPSSHNASIAYSMHAILTGANLLIMSDRSGPAVARAIESFRPSTVVSFPQTYVELAGLELDQYDLGSVTAWINSGDAAHEPHIRRLVEHGYHYRGKERIEGSQFIDGLGSSEMGHSSFRIIHTPYTNNYDRCIGLPQEWVEAVVLDEDGNELPIGEVGMLGVKSPSITGGYWNNSVLSYKSRLRGYWLTGDLVYRDRMGCFYHLDRITDAIRTRQGMCYSLQTEEHILKNNQNLAECTVIGVSDTEAEAGYQKVIAFLVPTQSCSMSEEEFLMEINNEQRKVGRPLLAAVHLLDACEIPVGVTGKVLKRVLRERYKEKLLI
jgi:acyl-coenzyme A synthetase/AMP-(fatty) acid ligase